MRKHIMAAGITLVTLIGQCAAEMVLVEAESFQDRGGWKLDTQFINIMGSPYLLAHGLGQPVADAATTVTFPETGTYRVFVRTKDWVARWNAPGQPGRFQLLVNGQALEETFGTKSADWFWHDGGTVEITKKTVSLALHDLTGFAGRCDAIVFSNDLSATPPNDSAPLAAWRKQWLGLSEDPVEAGPFDLVVVGGGYGGMGAAISAARMGCKVALIQDRPVLGGNGSSEVRVWANGLIRRGRYPAIGEIVAEFEDSATKSPGTEEEFEDAKKEAIVRAEKNISLYLNHFAYAVEMQKDSKDTIQAVLAFDTRTSRETRFSGKLFADCTGHATIGFLAGADYETQDKGHMGMSNMWRWADADQPQSFPAVPWALDLKMADFPYPREGHGQWFWESGFDKDPIHDLEYTRDWNLRAVYGAFNAMKNGDGKDKHKNAVLTWIAYIGGPRESRRLVGDVMLTRDDVAEKKEFEDGCVPSTWSIDLHYPKQQYAGKFPDDPFISMAKFDRSVDKKYGYPIPYRCFYSRNIVNLFMAGRNISVTHEALGTVRVMNTIGMMGEVVGKAASICVRYGYTPRGVYESHFEELQELMKLKGVMRRDTVFGNFYVAQGAKELLPAEVEFIDPKSLPGIVIDDVQAKLTGKWNAGEGLKRYIGDHYLYHGAKDAASATFEFSVPKSGKYEVRFAYQPHQNRSTKTPVTVKSVEGEKTIRVNQRVAAPLPKGFISLGVYQFDADTPGTVIVTNDGVDGNVHVDAIQILPAPTQ